MRWIYPLTVIALIEAAACGADEPIDPEPHEPEPQSNAEPEVEPLEDVELPENLSFAEHVHPIFRQKCVPCHEGTGPGTAAEGRVHGSADLDVAHQSARQNPEQMARSVQTRMMPLVPPGTPLSKEEIAWIVGWIDADMPP